VLGCHDNPDMQDFRQPHFCKKVVENRSPDSAALVLDRDRGWSFKIAGPESAVDAVRRRSSIFSTRSRRRRPAAQVETSEGWKEGPPNKMRFATIETTQKDVELSVFEPRQGGDGALANVNRWRGQLGWIDRLERSRRGHQEIMIDNAGHAGRHRWQVEARHPPMGQVPPNPMKKRPRRTGSNDYKLPEAGRRSRRRTR